jgi:16S rRNA (uracil1498-N3)-methyltransferase
MHPSHQFLFFASRIEAAAIELDEEESRHAAAVLRHAPGDPIRVTNGAGTLYECRVDSIDRKHVTATVLRYAKLRRHQCPLHLVVGLPERVAFENLLTDLAALGVERITPLVSKHCQRPWWDRWEEKFAERLRGKMIAGMKQSGYPFLPQLDSPLAFADLSTVLAKRTYMADPIGKPFSSFIDMIKGDAPGSSVCIVGPPGGLESGEGGFLRMVGVVPINIAPSRLTTELAAVVMASEIMGIRIQLQ